MKRRSDSKMVEASRASYSANVQIQKPSDTSVGADEKSFSKRRFRVKIKRWHAVARWTWNAGEGEVCGICQNSFEDCAPGVKYPGDESPVVWGKCGHAFHLQCVSTWLENNSTCPFCRVDWEFKADADVTNPSS